MGFSVSGSAAIIFAGMFIAFGMWYTASANSFERVNDARKAMSEGALDEGNTDIRIQSAVHDNPPDETRVNVTNNGTTALDLERTDILLDGTYRTDWQSGATVDGDAGTDLWLPGERLSVNVTGSHDRVKVVTENGVAAGSGVTAT